MISVNEAKQLIRDHVTALPSQKMPLQNAVGLTLAENIFATGNFPPFSQSAMDGYAFAYDGWQNKPLPVAGVVQAGAAESIQFAENEAVRIFTGAPLPAGADTVVMQEKTTVENGVLFIQDESLAKGSNVRAPGAEIENGALAFPMGSYLSPGAIGFIAGMGVESINAIPLPVVAILVTGKELQQPGQPLQYGQVYESNSFALTAALQQCGVVSITKQLVDDNLTELESAIGDALQNADMVLLTGGVSVGDYDFVTQALAAKDVETIFHKVKQRPGKPLLFGKMQHKVVFGLPGNPSSVLTCFYEYVLPALQQLLKRKDPFIETTRVPLAADYFKNTSLTHFLKGWVQNGEVLPLDAQESYKMKSFAMANCLIVLPEDGSRFNKGEIVEVHQLL